MKLNDRGQTLVLFILLLPVLLLVLGYLVDIGLLHIQKRKIDRTVDMVLDYGIQHQDSIALEEEMYQLLIMNLKSVEEEKIVITDTSITVAIKKTVDRVFPFLFPNQNHTIQMTKTIYKRGIEE